MAITTTELGARQLESTGVLRELSDIEQRLRCVERELELMDKKQEAHIQAKRQDARECIARGDTETVVVITPPEENDGEQAVSKLDGIVTFIKPGKFDLQQGDVIRVRIYDVGDSHANAVTLEHVEGDQ